MKRTMAICMFVGGIHAGFCSQELNYAATAIANLCNTSNWCMVANVDDTGFDREILTNIFFTTCVTSISNNWQSITNEWPAIRDDFDKRVIFRNLIGFAGTNAFYHILDFVADDASTNDVSRLMIIDSLMAPRTPLWMFTADHYNIDVVSNLLGKVICVFPDGSEEGAHYRSVLSGEYKRILDEARADGAIEF